jgi:dihydrofolate reductase (trimethoprim resistance protein)
MKTTPQIQVKSKFALGDLVTKTKGSEWTGRVVGYYSTTLTPVGVCVESSIHTGSVQIYPESALESFDYEY